MADNHDIVTFAIVAVLAKRKRRQRRTRTVWEKEWLKRRKHLSAYRQIITELRLEDPENYRRYLRMDTATFEDLLGRLRHKISKQNTNMRESITAEERLAVTLRFLATGESYSSLQFQFRISTPTLTKLIPEVCQAIFDTLKGEFLSCPKSPQEWLQISNSFSDRWQFPHCLGAIDGKHIKILHPAHSGSLFYNYKGFYSIVLMAIVDADYKFTFVDVGCQGRISDGGVVKNTDFWKALLEGNLGLPEPTPLPPSQDPAFDDLYSQPMPYFFAGDDAFALESYMMKPYGQRNLSEEKRIFNYRLSRARRISENVFGILSSRFRVFLTILCNKPDSAIKIVLAAITLHNYLRSKVPDRYTPPGTVDGESGENGLWRAEVPACPFKELPNFKKGRQGMKAERVRDVLCQYMNGPGQIPWQWNALV